MEVTSLRLPEGVEFSDSTPVPILRPKSIEAMVGANAAKAAKPNRGQKRKATTQNALVASAAPSSSAGAASNASAKHLRS